jgi:hypothetical protein
MTADEFAKLVDVYGVYRDKGKSRLNRLRNTYAAYRNAYMEKSFVQLAYMASLARGNEWEGVLLGTKHRDAGTPMLVIPELM